VRSWTTGQTEGLSRASEGLYRLRPSFSWSAFLLGMLPGFVAGAVSAAILLRWL
jgi:hypothetical protein